MISPQIRRAAELGLIDPDRVAVLGHSHGWYAVGALLAESDLFQAGVSLMGLFDLSAMYCNANGAEYAFLSGQMRMGVPLWDDPERYRRNSPHHQAKNIDAPLLLIAGELDRAAPWYESDKMWNALRTLGKTAEIAIYPGEDHDLGEWSPANRLDACERVLRFLEQNLSAQGH